MTAHLVYRYSTVQVLSVVVVSLGVALTTISAKPKGSTSTQAVESNMEYVVGISILSLALVLSSAMGLAQDQAYTRYGRGHWEEGMFFLHFLSLPMFLPLLPDLRYLVSTINSGEQVRISGAGVALGIPKFYLPLLVNIMTQLVCVSGVHRLTARVSSLTVTLVLVVRKAVSLLISVVALGNSRGDAWLWGGSLAVLVGTLLYTWDGTRKKIKSD